MAEPMLHSNSRNTILIAGPGLARAWQAAQGIVCGARPRPYLAGDALDPRKRKVQRVSRVPVVLLELVQVRAQQLAHQDQVLLR